MKTRVAGVLAASACLAGMMCAPAFAASSWGGPENEGANQDILPILSGDPISIPINICGNAIGILGFAGASAECANAVDGN